MPNHWSTKEVALIVADYFSMLTDELTGKAINKTAHRKALITLLNNRSEGAIEFKHQNISAVLIRNGLPYIKGYKAMTEYQQLLEQATIQFVNDNRQWLEPIFAQFADAVVPLIQQVNYEHVLDSPPEHEEQLSEPKVPYAARKPVKINYLQREQNNSALGIQGEKIAFDYEKWQLNKLGKPGLADKIEWISQHDDGAGFDILSKKENGTDKYIEVKTTKLGKETPIFFSRNEYEFSKRNNNYFIYRVFNFSKEPKLFQLEGSFDLHCNIEPVQYKGTF